MRILVVEDEPSVRDALGRGLRAQTWAVDLVASGREAIERIYASPYDAVVLDLGLPDRDGLVVCREIRASGSPAAILMLTARDAVDDRVRGLDAGADDYLPKPFAFAELVARLRALGRRRASPQPARLEVGELTIDTARRSAELGGRRLELTPKEYALLEILAARAGQVVTRSEIAEQVWDESFDPWSNTIEVHVNRLRRKLERAGQGSLLRTRRGEGYVLEAAADAP